jgi:hypothetical protein
MHVCFDVRIACVLTCSGRGDITQPTCYITVLHDHRQASSDPPTCPVLHASNYTLPTGMLAALKSHSRTPSCAVSQSQLSECCAVTHACWA